ncbi:MAG: lipoyl protein ligase domain-containing protein [Gemmataceae bacterium]
MQTSAKKSLAVYLLGLESLDTVLTLQRRLMYELGERTPHGPRAYAILCEHPLGITIGRSGSRRHLKRLPENSHRIPAAPRWMARGGGTMLHAPGQLHLYLLLPLLEFRLSPAEHVQRLLEVGARLLQKLPEAAIDADPPGLSVRGRRILHIGAAVRHGISMHGLILNVNPDLEPFADIACDGQPRPMTSLARESAHKVRMTDLRTQAIAAVVEVFDCGSPQLFHQVPTPPTANPHHAIADRR